MGPALIVKVYHKLSDTKDIDIEELKHCSSFPGQAVMDNHIYYNENPIIGHLPVSNTDMMMLIYRLVRVLTMMIGILLIFNMA